MGLVRHAGERVGVVRGRVPTVRCVGGPEASAGRVFRGGSWSNVARDVRAAIPPQDRPGRTGTTTSAFAVPSSGSVSREQEVERRARRSGGRSPAQTASQRDRAVS